MSKGKKQDKRELKLTNLSKNNFSSDELSKITGGDDWYRQCIQYCIGSGGELGKVYMLMLFQEVSECYWT